jgi:hypothetical protein
MKSTRLHQGLILVSDIRDNASDGDHLPDSAYNIYKGDDIVIEEGEWIATVERLIAGLDAMLTTEQLEAQLERRRLVEQRYQQRREERSMHDNHQVTPD